MIKKTPHGRMYVYVWEDTTSPGDLKVGEHYTRLSSDTEARAEVEAYIRSSLSRQRYKYDQGSIVVHLICDATEAAKKHNKLYINAHFDTVLRTKAALPGKIPKSEFHNVKDIPAFLSQVQDWLDTEGSPRPSIGLSYIQIREAARLIKAFNEHQARVVLCELAPRMGKTIWSMVVSRELKIPLTIVTSYIQTSHTSFFTDLMNWAQFKNMIIVDTSKAGWATEIAHGLAQQKQVVAWVSLCPGNNRTSRLEQLAAYPVERLWVVDEADYGAWRTDQATPLKEMSQHDRVILMTGTGGDRASILWPIDATLSVTYNELLVVKHDGAPASVPRLTHFTHDPTRDQMYPDMSYGQVGFVDYVNEILKHCPEQDTATLPSLLKMIMDPVAAKGFITTLFRGLFEGGRVPQLNMDRFIPDRPTPNVVMVFVSAAATTDNIDIFARIVRETLPSWTVYVLHGGNTTGREAEHEVRAAVKTAKDKNRNLMILAAHMGQRSFSIPELNEVYLMYDGGAAAPTMQKTARASTPNGLDKKGSVISVSFDPNRDGMFDAMILHSAENLAKSYGTSLRAAIRQLMDTNEFWEAIKGERVRVTSDRYLEQLNSSVSSGRFGQLLGSGVPIELLTDEVRDALLHSGKKMLGTPLQPVALHGDTYKPRPVAATALARSVKTKTTKADERKIREAATYIYEHAEFFYHGTRATCVQGMLDALETNAGYQADVQTHIDMDWSVVHQVLSLPGVDKRLQFLMTI